VYKDTDPGFYKNDQGIEFIISYQSEKFTNMSKLVIKILDENGEVIYTTTYNFDMDLMELSTPSNSSSSNDSDSSSSSDSNYAKISDDQGNYYERDGNHISGSYEGYSYDYDI
jgi:hypothetical protein